MMNRLTGRYESGVVYVPRGMLPEALDQLAAYEDTELTPKQVNSMVEDTEAGLLTWFEAKYNMPVGQLMALLVAHEEGRLLVAPCKVGDTVWFIRPTHSKKEIEETMVEKIVAKDKGLYMKLACNAMYETSCKSIGKTVFLTYEEAEAALVTGKNVGNMGGGSK